MTTTTATNNYSPFLLRATVLSTYKTFSSNCIAKAIFIRREWKLKKVNKNFFCMECAKGKSTEHIFRFLFFLRFFFFIRRGVYDVCIFLNCMCKYNKSTHKINKLCIHSKLLTAPPPNNKQNKRIYFFRLKNRNALIHSEQKIEEALASNTKCQQEKKWKNKVFSFQYLQIFFLSHSLYLCKQKNYI